MKTIIEVGDIILYTNKAGQPRKIVVQRVDKNWWYASGNAGTLHGRNSYETLNTLSKQKDFKIVKA
jgi:hypothetical protein